MAKGWFEKFGGFTISFAEITVENELGNHSPLAAEPDSTDNLSPCREKVKPETGNLSTFFYILRVSARERSWRMLKKDEPRHVPCAAIRITFFICFQ